MEQVSCSDFTAAACAGAREVGDEQGTEQGAAVRRHGSAASQALPWGWEKVSFCVCVRAWGLDSGNSFNPVNTQSFLHIICLQDCEGD